MRLLVLTGATATGKTRLAVAVAHRLGSEIISADSRQVYRGLDLGTGKDLHEYSQVSPPVPYHLIDIVEPSTVYTLYHFQRDCYQVLQDRREQQPYAGGTPLVMAGGTPLYLASVLLDYRIPHVPDNPQLRRRLEPRPHDELVEELRRSGSEQIERTDLSSKRRVIRALEIVEHSRHHPVVCSESPPFPITAKVYAIRIDRKELHRRIDHRLEERLHQGMVDEVRSLLESGLPRQRLDELGLEYREIAAYLAGDKPFAEMVRSLQVAIHRFARRQEIWLRGFPKRGIPVSWIDVSDVELVLGQVADW